MLGEGCEEEEDQVFARAEAQDGLVQFQPDGGLVDGETDLFGGALSDFGATGIDEA